MNPVSQASAKCVEHLLARMDQMRQVDYLYAICKECPGAVQTVGQARIGWDWEPGKDSVPEPKKE